MEKQFIFKNYKNQIVIYVYTYYSYIFDDDANDAYFDDYDIAYY